MAGTTTAVRFVLTDRYAAKLEARCEQQAALVADLKVRGEDARDAEAVLAELEQALMLLEAEKARILAHQAKE